MEFHDGCKKISCAVKKEYLKQYKKSIIFTDITVVHLISILYAYSLPEQVITVVLLEINTFLGYLLLFLLLIYFQ